MIQWHKGRVEGLDQVRTVERPSPTVGTPVCVRVVVEVCSCGVSEHRGSVSYATQWPSGRNVANVSSRVVIHLLVSRNEDLRGTPSFRHSLFHIVIPRRDFTASRQRSFLTRCFGGLQANFLSVFF
jgi:hypothetical protein